ncbi:glycosyltransferase [Mucilaginibacter gynuensis]|uniref:Glycosyltransferase n=1 Tax=Mucilaginibacter gynuensis TaxID=1302236 RepID=A0ABP8H3R2_9SPHI
MVNIKYKVCVVTVTYGNRWRFLKQVLERVLSFDAVSNVVVVDNASVYKVDEHARQLNDQRIFTISNTENKGSAGGYNQGIAYAFEQTRADFIWLLDDDNLPGETALDGLLTAWDDIGGGDNKALFCLREDRAAHIRIAKGENPYRYYLVPDNFLGFNIFRIITNRLNKLKDKRANNAHYLKYATMPYVPYGGLLIPRQIVAKIGYPNERFFLYVDDSEYSYRITQQNGVIWLVPGCKVVDIDQSQGIGYVQKPLRSHLLDQWNFRTYYHIRNRIYFYSRVAIKNQFLFKINKAIYLAFLGLIGILSDKTTEYKQLVQAVNDGLKGKLGEAAPERYTSPSDNK